jgi:hypothetical protein
MFLKNVGISDFFKNSSLYSIFLTSKFNNSFLKEKFFFKKPNIILLDNYNLFISNDISPESELSIKLNLFKKNINFSKSSPDFDILIFFYIYNSSLVEIYKIFILLYLKNLNNF